LAIGHRARSAGNERVLGRSIDAGTQRTEFLFVCLIQKRGEQAMRSGSI